MIEEAETSNEIIVYTSPFKTLMEDLERLLYCKINKKLIVNPVSLPSGRIYDKHIAQGIIRGDFSK